MPAHLSLGLPDRTVTLAAGVEPYEQTTASSSDAFHGNTVATYLTPGLTDRTVTLAHLPLVNGQTSHAIATAGQHLCPLRLGSPRPASEVREVHRDAYDQTTAA